MDNKKLVVDRAQEIGELNAKLSDHWFRAQSALAEGHVDEAISLLNAYYRLKDKLENAETQLRGTLKGYFADM